MAASSVPFYPRVREPSPSPNRSTMTLCSVERSLKSCSKGRLTYDPHWKPTRENLEELSKPPSLSLKLSPVSLSSTTRTSNKRDGNVIFSGELAESKDIEESNQTDGMSSSSYRSDTESDSEKETRASNVQVPMHEELLEKELQASFDWTHVAVYNYGMEKKRQAEEEIATRKKKMAENSKRLSEEKNRYLQQKEHERVDEMIKSVKALQRDEERKTEEAKQRQQELKQSHEASAARVVRKVKEMEDLRLRLLKEEQQVKRELQQLEASFITVQETAQNIQQIFKECKFQSYLSTSASDILSETKEVLKLSLSNLNSAKENERVTEGISEIMQKCSILIPDLLQKAKELVNEANTKAAKDEADRQIKEEAKAKEEEEKKQQALKTSQEKQTVSSSTSKPTSNSSDQSKTGISKDLASCISATAWKEFSRLASYRSAIVKEAEPLNTDKTLKQYKFDLHKAVTTPINAISDQSPRHLRDKIQRLAQLLSGQAVQMGGKQISIIKHPAAKSFCKDLLAKKLVQQGSQQVSSSHSSAFPIAAVIVGIWSSFPDIGDLVLAQFCDQCPFLVPFYIPRTAELADVEYFASLGYQCSEGEIEEQDKFLKRMTGIVRLYAAVISSLPPQGQSQQHPFGLEKGWTWLARMLNLDPRPDYTATALYEFLAVAGHALMRQYKKQFGKLLNILVLEYVPKIEKVTAKAQSGPVVRLKVFLETCIKDQKIPVPDGYLTPNWWRSPSY
ncbi:unnamed protein product [Pocillopora meandrina]|uniref:mRNA export factor GLE1 n=1 Tax=Pocillopora meandrina TaxID=46732 RepID=A0AAU9WXA9_9CNID|nr:unnamed protein product [Pocillopora meandrina]